MFSVELSSAHTRNCRVLPARAHLLKELPQRGVAAEIGVANGDFSQQILEVNDPAQLHLVDAWETDRYRADLDKVRNRFAAKIDDGTVHVHQGLSVSMMPRFSDAFFDWVYIDTNHSYETTLAELQIAADKVRPGGLIAGDDFTNGNPARGLRYGVVQACNRFCVDKGWEYAFLTLDSNAHFSYALRKMDTG